MLKTGGSQESPSHVELQSVLTEERQRQRGSSITTTVANIKAGRQVQAAPGI